MERRTKLFLATSQRTARPPSPAFLHVSADWHGPSPQIRDVLGHASIVTTERYDNQQLERLQVAAGELESGKGVPKRRPANPGRSFTFLAEQLDSRAVDGVSECGSASPRPSPAVACWAVRSGTGSGRGRRSLGWTRNLYSSIRCSRSSSVASLPLPRRTPAGVASLSFCTPVGGDALLVVDAAVQGDVDAEGQESHAESLSRLTAAEKKIRKTPRAQIGGDRFVL